MSDQQEDLKVLNRAFNDLYHTGTHGARALSAIRISGNLALQVLIRREIKRIQFEEDVWTKAIERAQDKAHEDE